MSCSMSTVVSSASSSSANIGTASPSTSTTLKSSINEQYQQDLQKISHPLEQAKQRYSNAIYAEETKLQKRMQEYLPKLKKILQQFNQSLQTASKVIEQVQIKPNCNLVPILNNTSILCAARYHLEQDLAQLADPCEGIEYEVLVQEINQARDEHTKALKQYEQAKKKIEHEYKRALNGEPPSYKASNDSH